MTFWNISVIALCFLLLFYLLWKEKKRHNKACLSARMVATVLAVVGLAGLVLPLFYNKKIKTNSTGEAVLLTEDYSRDSVEAFLSKRESLPVFTLVKQPVFDKAVYLADIAFLQNDSGRYRKLHIFGNGLNDDELSAIRTVPFAFHTTTTQSGITSIGWNQHLFSGDKLIVQGQYENNNNTAARIVLNGFGINLDSCTIPANHLATFQLQTKPRHLDRAVYSVIVTSGKDTTEKEPLPVEVSVPKPVKVLLLAASPDFENKFLKNWLAQNGYPVVARTRISRDKFTKEYSNLPVVAMNSITPSWLGQFDVMVADATELSTLSGAEGTAIQTAVSQQGMGLLVKLDSAAGGNHFFDRGFPIVQDKTTGSKVMRLYFTNDTASAAGMLKAEQPFYIRPVPGNQPLVQDGKGQTVISSRLLGIGKVVATILGNTYTWQLSGNEESYGYFWAELLRNALKKTELPEVFSISTKMPVINEKAVLQLQTSFPEPPQVLASSGSIAMEQNYQLPFLWQGNYWPQTKGWVSFSTAHQTIKWFYVFGNSDWLNVRAEAKKRLTQNRAASDSQLAATTDSPGRWVRTEISKVYFFLLFLFAASFLWFERKYNSR